MRSEGINKALVPCHLEQVNNNGKLELIDKFFSCYTRNRPFSAQSW